MSRTYDAIVLGLGGAGSSAAWHLARRGLRVLGLDRAGPVNALGSSHGGSRIVRMAYAEGGDFVPLLIRAHALWDELACVAGEPILRRCGVMFVGAPGSTVVADTVESARRHGFAFEHFDAAALRHRTPGIAVADDAVACFDPAAGLVSPEHAVRVHLRLAAAAGAELRFDEAAAEWTVGGGLVTVRTGQGTYRARRLVVCAGAWSPTLLGRSTLRLRVQRQVQHWFAVPPSRAPALDPGRFPVHVWDDADLFYCMPMIDGPDGGVKCCVELDPPEINPDALDRTVAPHEIARAKGIFERHLPGLTTGWLRSEVCMYAATPDNRFHIGRLPGTPEVVLAIGLGGHGFKFTPAIGALAADLVADTIDPSDALLAPFRPERAGVREALAV